MGILEDFRKEKRERILRNGEYFRESSLYCPYCAHEQQDISDVVQTDGDEYEFQCQKCDRHFAYYSEIVFSGRKLK